MAPTVMRHTSDDDNVFLDMTRAGFDLSDRGVTSNQPRRYPVWTEHWHLSWGNRPCRRAGTGYDAILTCR
jgi:hypothetical protein